MSRPVSASTMLSRALGNGTALPERAEKKPRGLRQMSVKRRNEAAARREVKLDAELRDQGCVAGNTGLFPHIVCGGRLEANELIRRSQWRGGHLVLGNIVTLCSHHHRFVTDNPDLACEAGMQLKSWQRTEQL